MDKELPRTRISMDLPDFDGSQLRGPKVVGSQLQQKTELYRITRRKAMRYLRTATSSLYVDYSLIAYRQSIHA